MSPHHHATGPVRLFLRHRTHLAHTALNQHPMLSGITRPGYPISLYQALLAAYQPLYAGLEIVIEQFITKHNVAFDYDSRRKLPWLQGDLQFFSHPSLEAPKTIEPIVNYAELIGLLYVIEGSTLGGGLIARLIFQHMGINANRGGAFFNAYGPDTQANWQAFCAFIETSGDDPNSLEFAACRAVNTFKLFQQALDAASNKQPGLCSMQEAG